jgi:hypothetical protein
MFAPRINSIKKEIIFPTNSHYYKSVEMLKQFKFLSLALTCFGSSRNHHQGTVLFLAKTTDMVFSVLVDMDSVNAMASYRSVVRACFTRSCTTFSQTC